MCFIRSKEGSVMKLCRVYLATLRPRQQCPPRFERDGVRQSLILVTIFRLASTLICFGHRLNEVTGRKLKCSFAMAAARCHARVKLPRHHPLFIRPREDRVTLARQRWTRASLPRDSRLCGCGRTLSREREKKRSHRSE